MTSSYLENSTRTVVHAFERLGAVGPHETVVVQGTDPLGLWATALAAHAGAAQVITIGGPPNRLQLAQAWGADTLLDVSEVPNPLERQQAVLDLTSGRGADIVIEASGVPAAFNEGLGLVKVGGRYLIIGQTLRTSVEMLPSTFVAKQLTVIGVRGASIGHYYRALRFLERNGSRFRCEDLTSSVRPLPDINTAMTAMQAWNEIKPAISFA